MRLLLTCLLIGLAGPAQAMNWEGHDDWMADLAPALAYRDAVPQAHRHDRPPLACPAPSPAPLANPYEQIPLPVPDCRGHQEGRENAR